MLIEPVELADLLGGEEPLVLADVRWTLGGPSGQADFEVAHLPGAQWVDLEAALSAPPGEGGRHPLPDPAVFTQAMRALGVTGDHLVVCYDAATSLAAARLWWLLTDSGHGRVRVLNGGLAAWQRAGGTLESGPGTAPPRGSFTARPGQRLRLDGAEIAATVALGTAPQLVDVRAAERYTGASEPLDPVAGHIPGALNLPSMDNLEPDGRFRPAAEIEARYAEAGLVENAVLYCGSGITAAHSLLALESAGRTAALYPGSWSDWIADPERPVATGS